jgi:hypothetical protein
MTIPAELKRSTPRPVSLSAAGWKAIRTYGLKAAVVAAVGAYIWISGGAGIYSAADMGSLMVLRAGAGCLVLAVAIGRLGIRRQSQLLRYGRAAIARVTLDVTPHGLTRYGLTRCWQRLRYGSGGAHRLRCEFRMMDGGTGTATVETGGRNIAADAEIVILYDPDQPESAVMYPVRMLKIAER